MQHICYTTSVNLINIKYCSVFILSPSAMSKLYHIKDHTSFQTVTPTLQVHTATPSLFPYYSPLGKQPGFTVTQKHPKSNHTQNISHYHVCFLLLHSTCTKCLQSLANALIEQLGTLIDLL